MEEAPDPRVSGLEAHARIDTDGSGGHILTLSLHEGADVERTEAEAESCAVLVELVALKVALALNPSTVSEPATHRAAAPQPGPGAALSPEPPVPKTQTATPSRPGAFLQIAGEVGRGRLRDVDLGGAIAIGVAGRRWRILLGAHAAGSPPIRQDRLDGGEVRLAHVVGEFGPCWQLREGRLLAPLCASVEVGASMARGVGLPENRTSWRLHVGVGAGGGIVWPADGRVRLVVHLTTHATVLAPVFELSGIGRIHRTSPMSGRFGVGVELGLGRSVAR